MVQGTMPWGYAAVGHPAIDAFAVANVVGEEAHKKLPVRGWAPQEDAHSHIGRTRNDAELLPDGHDEFEQAVT